MTDYTRYDLGARRRLLAGAAGCALCFAAAWLVFRHPLVAVLAAPAGLWVPRLLEAHLLQRRRERLRLHFKEMLHALASLLAAGRSVENAFLALERDVAMMVADDRSELLRELRGIANRLRNGEPLELLLADFARRSGLEEARSFAEAFAVCKRAGGDLVGIVRSTARLIGEKMETELEISVMMARKKFESRIMMAMPFAFVGAIGFIAPDYMAPLYKGAGWLLVSVCLLLLLLCCWWMHRIMRIEM